MPHLTIVFVGLAARLEGRGRSPAAATAGRESFWSRWVWSYRYNPKVSRIIEKRAGENVAVTAVARKLAAFIWAAARALEAKRQSEVNKFRSKIMARPGAVSNPQLSA